MPATSNAYAATSTSSATSGAGSVKEEAADRKDKGLPNTAQVERYLSQLAAEVVDAADITDLNGVALQRLQNSATPHLAASALRRLLACYDYSPDHERAAVDLVIRQMETFANKWAPGGQQATQR